MLALLSRIPARAWAYVFGALAVLGLLIGAYGYGYGSGKAKATAKAAQEMQEYRDQVAVWQAEQSAKVTELENQHEQRVSDLRAEFARENAEAAERDAAVISRLRNGTERLRLQASSCSTAEAGEASAASGGADGAGTVELASETSAALWAIARDGDRAIRKLTALQEWARSAVELCGGSE